MAISPLTLLFRAVDQASPDVKNITQGVRGMFGEVTKLSFAYNQVQQTIQSFVAQGQQGYRLLIGQNVELQQQLLSTQSTLAATNKVIQDGVQIQDPTSAIKALEGPVKEAVNSIRKGSLELVGVTSAQLIPLFQVTAQSSANIGASLQDSADLTLSFAAALGTLQIPLDQARQELNSIYTAQITSDSQLAKSLNLNNQQVNQWKAQGVLVERLTERLSAFRAGNQLAANTIEGVSSNIQEIFDEISRVAGEPLLQPIVDSLNVVYKFLNQNKDQIQDIASRIVAFFLEVGNRLSGAVEAIRPVLETLFNGLFNQLGAEANAASKTILLVTDTFVTLVKVSAPLLQVLASIAETFAEFATTDIGGIVLQATLLVSLIGQIYPLLVPISVGFQAAATSAALFAAAANGSATAQLVLQSFAPTLAAIATSYAAAGGGAVGFAAAMGTATSAMTTFGIAAATALTPLIAIGGAITIALIVKQTGDLKQANEELEEFRQQNDQLSQESINLATKLKSLNDAERANGQLTEEQIKKRAALQRISKDLVGSLQAQIEAIKQVQPANEEQRRTQEVQIAQLQKQIDLQSKLSGGVKLAANDLQQLGGTYEQLNKRIADAEAQIKSGGAGDAARFKAANQELIKLTEQQVQLGQITAEEGARRLEQIANDTRNEIDIQTSAQDTITKLRQGETDKRVRQSETEQQKIQALIAQGQLSQVEGENRITQAKKSALQQQVKDVEQAIQREIELEQTRVNQQIASFDKQISEAQKRRSEAESKGDKGATRLADEELTKLESDKRAAQSSLKIDSQRLTDLRGQQAKFQTEIAQLEGQQRDRRRQEELKDFDERQQILEADFARKLVSETEFNKRSLELTRQKVQLELKQIAEQQKQLPATDKEGQEALAVRAAVAQKRLADAESKFNEQRLQTAANVARARQQILESQFAQGLISQTEYNQKSFELTRQQAEAEIKETERKLSRLPVGDNDKRVELEAKVAEARKRIADAEDNLNEQRLQTAANVARARQQILESQFAQGLISQTEYNQKSFELTRQQAEAEIKETERKLSRLPSGDNDKRVELEAKVAEARKRIAESLENFEREKSRARLAAIETEQVQIELAYAEGNATQEEFAQQSLDITQRKLDAELAEVERQRNKLKDTDAVKLNELAKQETEIRKRQIDNLQQFQEQQIKLLEQNQQRATQVLQQAEADRLVQITQLEAQRAISKQEADELRINTTKQTIQTELKLEQERLEALQALPPFSNPEREEQRQGQIRQSRIRTAQLTKSLIENEVQQQEAAYRTFEERLNRQSQAIKNAATAQRQASEQEQRLAEASNKALQNQISLLDVRKQLMGSLSGFLEGELGILRETAKTDEEKKQVAETTALIKLKSIREQAAIERQILELNLQQKQAALDIEKIKLRADKAQAAADTKLAEANLKKAQARPGATKEEIEAAQLELDAAKQKEVALLVQETSLGQQQVVIEQQAQAERTRQGQEQLQRENQARLELAKNRVDTKLGEREQQQLQREVLNRFGIGDILGLKNLNFNSSPPPQTQLQVVPLPNTTVQRSQVERELMGRSQALETARTSNLSPVNITLNNTFNNADRAAGNNVVQQIRKELYDLGTELNRQLK